VETAGSSLLYSKQLYAEARRHLRQGGILQQWSPRGDAVVRSSVGKAVQESFAYVRVFRSINGIGYYLLASDAPFPDRDSQELAARLPASAARDFVEWGPAPTAAGQFETLLCGDLSPIRLGQRSNIHFGKVVRSLVSRTLTKASVPEFILKRAASKRSCFPEASSKDTSPQASMVFCLLR
jgi:hypothetical protein